MGSRAWSPATNSPAESAILSSMLPENCVRRRVLTSCYIHTVTCYPKRLYPSCQSTKRCDSCKPRGIWSLHPCHSRSVLRLASWFRDYHRDGSSYRHTLTFALGRSFYADRAFLGISCRETNQPHSKPSTRQFSPLPMPQKATRWPGKRNSRSSAIAAVMGSDAVPILPR